MLWSSSKYQIPDKFITQYSSLYVYFFSSRYVDMRGFDEYLIFRRVTFPFFKNLHSLLKEILLLGRRLIEFSLLDGIIQSTECDSSFKHSYFQHFNLLKTLNTHFNETSKRQNYIRRWPNNPKTNNQSSYSLFILLSGSSLISWFIMTDLFRGNLCF